MSIKIVTIIGARPQIIKAAALSRAIRTHFSDQINELIVHTGQHYDENMSEVFFSELGIPQPDYNLQVGSGAHGRQTARMIEGIEDILEKEKPDYIVLYGDTNSTLAGAVAASKIHIPIVHIEAGLRSFNKSMPEEINRILCDHCSTLLFSPTKTGHENLVREGFNPANTAPFSSDNPAIYHCGDVMYDNSLYFSDMAAGNSKVLEKNQLTPSKYILSTIHRNNNTDEPKRLGAIFEALLQIVEGGGMDLVLPLHPRTAKMLKNNLSEDTFTKLSRSERIKIIEPVSFSRHDQAGAASSHDYHRFGRGAKKRGYFFKKPYNTPDRMERMMPELPLLPMLIRHASCRLGNNSALPPQQFLKYLAMEKASEFIWGRW